MQCCFGCGGGCAVSGSQFCTTCSGSVPSGPAVAATCGGVTNTAQNPLPAPDASGGNGTFPAVLQSTLTTGLNDALISATEFGLGALTCRLSVAATGAVQPAAAQSPAIGFNVSPGLLLLIGLGVLAFALSSKS